jgi:dTDP-glucose 4,6-dehydratase
VLEAGQPGRTYNIGGNAERTNLEIVEALCELLDRREPADRPRRELIRFVPDRPGHDRRYAIDAGRIRSELGWSPAVDLGEGLTQTVDWYLDNRAWWTRIRDGSYRGERLGLRGVAP